VGEGNKDIDVAIRSLGLELADDSKISAVIESVLIRNAELIHERGGAAFAQLMGEAMKELRGRADGAAVASALKAKLDRTGRPSE